MRAEANRAYEMDLSELTKIVFSRIQKIEPENVSKIMGFILLREPSEKEMMRLAIGSPNTLLSQIDEAKAMLGISSSKNSLQIPAQRWDPLLATDQRSSPQSLGFAPQAHPNSCGEDYALCNQAQFLNSEEKMGPSCSVGNRYLYQDASLGGSLTSRTSIRSPNLPELPIKACLYFNKGYCKHGENCRYHHGTSFSDASSLAFNSNMNELQSEGYAISPESLEKLEMEIVGLLRSRRGSPISISLLSNLYYEHYGRNLQAEGFLTESQRQGKAGHSLTKLLGTLKNSLRLIDMPQGQQSVILAEDTARYLEYQNERSELGGASAASAHQIYLTFPAQSTFNEDDVLNYFKQFGPVRDVRIPSQEKRMYGFVNFLYPETVSEILMMKNAHYICGSRVLVKPYKDKPRIVDKAYIEKNKLPMLYPYLDLDSEVHAFPREVESSRIVKLCLEEQKSNMIEQERRLFAGINLAQDDQRPYFNNRADDLKDSNNFPLEDPFGFGLASINSGLSCHDKNRTNNTYSDNESNHIELPDSPFT